MMKKAIWMILSVLVMVLAIRLVAIALAYFNFDSDYEFLLLKQDMLQNMTWKVAFYLHLLGGAVSIITGLLLFMTSWIQPSSKTHKLLGKIYFIAIMFIGGPTGLYLGFYAEAGYLATIGFIGMSTAWMLPTFISVQKITKGDIIGHHKWMIRSFALTLAGVTLRIMTPFGIHVLGWSYDTTFIITAYIPWMMNWGMAEAIIYFRRNHIKRLAETITLSKA
jgi:hypothetical protein